MNGINFSPHTGNHLEYVDHFSAGASTLLGVAKHFTFVENAGGLGFKSGTLVESVAA